jgi:hypothetical protein
MSSLRVENRRNVIFKKNPQPKSLEENVIALNLGMLPQVLPVGTGIQRDPEGSKGNQQG